MNKTEAEWRALAVQLVHLADTCRKCDHKRHYGGTKASNVCENVDCPANDVRGIIQAAGFDVYWLEKGGECHE